MAQFSFAPSPNGSSGFDPESIRVLSNAFEEAWQSLQSMQTTFHHDGHEDQTRELLARCIIEMARIGERDQTRLRDAALAHLAEANLRKQRH